MFSIRFRANFLADVVPRTCFKLAGVRELPSAGQLAGGVDRELAVAWSASGRPRRNSPGRSPSGSIWLVADGALGVGPVQLQALAERGGVGGLRALVQLGDVGRGRRGRRAEDLLEDPLPALHGRGPVGVRGQRQDARLRQDPAATTVGQGDPTEVVAGDALDPVVPGQGRVDERVVGVEQLQDAPIARGGSSAK